MAEKRTEEELEFARRAPGVMCSRSDGRILLDGRDLQAYLRYLATTPDGEPRVCRGITVAADAVAAIMAHTEARS